MDAIGFLCASLGSVADSHASVQILVSVVKMGTVLDMCTTKEHSSVAFLWANEISAKHIQNEMFLVYDGKFLSRKLVQPLK
jgi:sulfur relay (sulfurtransferase) complex TusBCD TusD component (DsrE family)